MSFIHKHLSIFTLIIFIFLFSQINSHKNYFTRFLKSTEKQSSKSNQCTLTNQPSRDPFPSLSKCYKYNNEACCLSVHDEIIDDYINDLLSSSCIRKYPLFENLMCLGCYPLEFKYITTKTEGDKTIKQIRICKSFAKSLWNATSDDGLNRNTTIFDNCGFKVSESISEILENKTKNIRSDKYIIPSETFDNFSDFFTYIKIPFYEDYDIVLQDNTDENCYNKSYFLKQNYFLLINLIIVILFIGEYDIKS